MSCFVPVLAILALLAAEEPKAAAQTAPNADVQAEQGNADALTAAADRVVKLYGAGLGRIENYGSGIVVSPQGHILTVLSPLLDTEELVAVFADGRRRSAKVVAADPAHAIAVLKAALDDAKAFDLKQGVEQKEPEPGTVVFALSNQFNIAAGSELASVQRGVIAGVASVATRVGLEQSSVVPSVLLLDMTANNPGSAGGALIDAQGRLLGMIGKELRGSASGAWVNYAIPIAQIAPFARAAIEGKPLPTAPVRASRNDLADRTTKPTRIDWRGIRFLPDVLDRTPAYVDGVEPSSPAEKAGIRADDLILFVGQTMVQSVQELPAAIGKLTVNEAWPLVLLRGESLVNVTLPPGGSKPGAIKVEPPRQDETRRDEKAVRATKESP